MNWITGLIARLFGRKPRVVRWTVQELYERTCELDDEKLKALGAEHVIVISKMLELLPPTDEWSADRALLHDLLRQLSVFPSARLCTAATIECERIKSTGVFNAWMQQQREARQA